MCVIKVYVAPYFNFHLNESISVWYILDKIDLVVHEIVSVSYFSAIFSNGRWRPFRLVNLNKIKIDFLEGRSHMNLYQIYSAGFENYHFHVLAVFLLRQLAAISDCLVKPPFADHSD